MQWTHQARSSHLGEFSLFRLDAKLEQSTEVCE